MRTIEEINAFKWIASHLDQLSFIRFSPLGEVKDMTSEKDIKNVEKKRKRGATGYNEYEIHIDGEVWKLKTEIRKNSRETLYIAFKKNNPSVSCGPSHGPLGNTRVIRMQRYNKYFKQARK